MKPKLIIVEGAQGVGKGTVTNMLREKVPYSTLMRLSGIKDKTKETGLKKVFDLRAGELKFILNRVESDTNFILDRCHLSEKVYCNLGYKEYDFKQETEDLNDFLNMVTLFYDVYIIGLILNNTRIYAKRLKRDKAEFEHSKFNIDNSIRQQNEYIKEINNIKENYKHIKCLLIDNEYSDEALAKIADFCGLEL